MHLPMPAQSFLSCLNYHTLFQEQFNFTKIPVFTQYSPYIPQQINSLVGYVFNIIFVYPSALLWRELVNIQSSAALKPNKRTRVGKQSSHKEKQNFTTSVEGRDPLMKSLLPENLTSFLSL